jgi:hypothetical protein
MTVDRFGATLPIQHKLPIDRDEDFELECEASTRKPGQVSAGETVDYTIRARAPQLASRIDVNCVLPPDTKLIGTPVPAANTSGDKLKWKFDNTDQAEATFRLKVQKQKASILFVTNRITGKATYPDGTEESASLDHSLKYARDYIKLAVQAVTPTAGQVAPDQQIDYTVTADAVRTADVLRVRVTLPPGTDLVPNSVTPPGGAAPNFSWTFNNSDASGPLKLSAKVQRKDRRPMDLRRITLHVEADGDFPGGELAAAQIDHDIPLALPGVKGVVNDISMNFPASNKVRRSALDGATVELYRLLPGGGREMSDSVATSMGGMFDVRGEDAGDYELVVMGKGDRYSRFSNSIDRDVLNVTQKRGITLTASTTPQQKDVDLPVSLVDRAAGLLYALNNF